MSNPKEKPSKDSVKIKELIAFAESIEDAPKKESANPFPVNCVARTVVAFDNNGFRNFKILTMTITNGLVTDIQYSDPYANFEAISRMELANEIAIMNLNNNWSEGKMLSK